VGCEIERALERIPPDHRVGFLFGLVVGKLDEQGMNETQVRGEIVKGLALIYGTFGLSKIPTACPDESGKS
jgi:hypothetical protein